jgi:hypothetical protein
MSEAQTSGNKTLYWMVDTLTSGEVGQASSVIDGQTYTLVKTQDGDSDPTGTVVLPITIEEARAAAGSIAFGATEPSTQWLACELAFCEYIAFEFRKAQAALNAADAETMFLALEPTSHALSRGLVNVARARFQLCGLDGPTIIVPFTAIFDNYIGKLPRTLA